MKKNLFILAILLCLFNVGFTQEMYYGINDTVMGTPGNQPTNKVSSVNLTGSIDILVLIVAFPDRSDNWVKIYNNSSEYPKLGAFPDGTLLSDYIDANGPIDVDSWVKPMIERYYDVHSGGRFTANVTFPKTGASKCYTTTHDFSYWEAANGSSNDVIHKYWDEMVNEAAQNLVSSDPAAFSGIDMIQIVFTGVSRDEFWKAHGGWAYLSDQTIHEPGNPSNVYYTGALGVSRNTNPVLHESLHVFGKAAGSPSGFDGLPDRGYDRSWLLPAPLYERQWNATPQFDIMYHNHDEVTQYSLYGKRPLLTHDLLCLGWIDNSEIETITSTVFGLKAAPVTYTLDAAQLADGQKRVFKVMIHENYSGTKDEYFLVEYKAGLEFDKIFHNLDEGLYNGGLLISHIKEKWNLITASHDNYVDIELAVPYNGWYGNPIPDDSYPRNYTTRPSSWAGRKGETDWLDDTKLHKPSGVNTYYYMPDGGRHYWETTVPPSKVTWDPTGGNWFFRQTSLKSDFFSDEVIRGYKADKFTMNTHPSTQDWNGNPTRIAITNIKEHAGYMSFNVYYDTNFWDGNIVSNTTWLASDGPYFVGGNLTINSGITLTIEEGTIVKFANNVKLTINGCLNAQGTKANRITFNRSGTSGFWEGILFNSPSTGNIEYCDFINAETGIEMDNSSPIIKQTNFRDCLIPLFCVGISYADIDFCEFTGSRDMGVLIDVGSTVWAQYSLFSNTQFYGIFNYGELSVVYSEIKNNKVGVFVNENAWADLGDECDEETGFNNILYNTDYDIDTDEDILAQINYWGGEEPENFGGSGEVEYEPWLDEPDSDNPWDGERGSNNSNSTQALASNDGNSFTSSEDFKLFKTGRSQMGKDLYTEACLTFEKFLSSYPASLLAPFSLQRWIQCKFKLNAKDEVLPYLVELRKSKSTSLLEHIDKMEVLVQRKLENHQTALALISAYKNASKSNSYNSFFKFQEGLTYEYDLNNTKQAELVFTEYKTEYADDGRIPIVQQHLNSLSAANQSMAKKSSKDDKNTDEANFPEKFVLNSAYPNPFNPSTTFRFYAPWAGKAKLEIFNSVGQKIRALEKTQFSKGYHNLFWNGRNDSGRSVTSGIYFTRFTAESLEKENQHFENYSKVILIR